MRFASSRQQTVLALSFVALFAVSAMAGINLSRVADGVATVWAANAFLAAGFILLRRKWSLACAAGCLAVNIALNMAGGDSLNLALAFSAINLGEAAGAAWLALRFCPSVP